ncbi:MAG: sigma 54-dependent Fis family transcriptional regulator [Myxococcales bacterium]|nr:sigma 54-dependent Fis family transcriptional regulator [Myxococcales bacterium]
MDGTTRLGPQPGSLPTTPPRSTPPRSTPPRSTPPRSTPPRTCAAPLDGWGLLAADAGTWVLHPLRGRTELGSDPCCDLVLPGAAPRQVRFEVRNGGVNATDLGAPTGTRLRGLELGARPVVVEAGDVLRLGRMPAVIVATGFACGRTWVQAGDLGSGSPSVWAALAQLALAAATDFPVLLRGESGTGKELAARLVHARSERARQPWVAVNCAALHADTLLAELFGAARGAYTGAVEARKGAFERADGGTLFLDEIGELSAAAQAALLRVLETGDVQVLGGSLRPVNVRIVCATHRDLAADVRSGRFRLDLLHRLAVAEVELAPLRQRPGDARVLLERWLGEPVSAAAGAQLDTHRWPGNVRELRNVARRLQMAGVVEVTAAAIDRAIGPRPPIPLAPRSLGVVAPTARVEAADQRQRTVQRLLEREGGSEAAWRASGLPRGTFYRYIKKLRDTLAIADAQPA